MGPIKARTLLIFLGVTLAVMWLTLFFSNRGMLIWGSGPEGATKLGLLKCQYFTGTGVVERQFLYSEQGLIGREACPRFVDLK